MAFVVQSVSSQKVLKATTISENGLQCIHNKYMVVVGDCCGVESIHSERCIGIKKTFVFW